MKNSFTQPAGALDASGHEPGSYNLHEVPVSTQHIIISQQNHRFNPGLRNQKPVEGILVNRWQLNYFRGVLAYYRQVVEAGRFDGSQDFRRISFEFAEGTLDTDFPDRCGARKHFPRINPLPRFLGEL